MNLDPHQRTVLASLIAGASAASLLFSGYRLLARRGQQSASPAHSTPPRSEEVAAFPTSTADVARWLSTTAVSPTTARLFARHGIDGEALAVLGVPDLIAMGVPAKDRSAVMAALAAHDDLPVFAGHMAGQRRVPPPPTAASHATDHRSLRTREAADGVRIIPLHAFLESAEDVFSDLVNPAPVIRSGGGGAGGGNSAEELDPQQQRLLMASRLYDLLDVFHDLSASEQNDAMLPLARRLNVVLTRPTPQPTLRRAPALPSAPTAPTAPTAASDPEAPPPSAAASAPASAAPLHDVVDNFIQLLSSPDLDGAPLGQLEPLASRIATQIERVGEVVRRLPPPLSLPLQAKCKAASDLLQRRLSSARAAASEGRQLREMPAAQERPSARQSPAPSHAAKAAAPSVTSLLEQLRGVFMRTRDSGLLEMEAAKRLVVVAAMVQEVQAIQAALAALPRSAQVQSGEEVAENVLALLEQLHSLTVDEARLSAATRQAVAEDVEDEVQPPEHAEEEADEIGAEFTAVTAGFLQRIAEVLQSPRYVSAPNEVKQGVLDNLTERVDALCEEAEKLPGPQRGAAVEALTQGKRLLAQAKGALMQEGERQSEPAAEADDGAGEKEDDEGEAEGEDAGEEEEGAEAGMPQVVPPAMDLDDAVTQIEKIFKFLTSDRFEAAPVAEKRLIADELLKRVHALKGPILQGLGDDPAHPIMAELVEPLEDLLDNMSHAAGPSREFSDILDVLREMEEVLSSRALSQAPPERQAVIAKATIEQLQRVTSTFPGLKPSERVAAEKLVAPLNEKLIALIRSSERDDASVPPRDRRRATTDAENPREIIEELQKATGVFQDSGFATASPAERAAIMDVTVAKMEGLLARCAKLPPSERDQLASMITNMLSRFQVLREATQSAVPKRQPPAPKAPQDGQRDAMFASVRDITAELRHGNRRGLKMSDAETKPLWNLLEMVSGVDDLTTEEQQLCDDFTIELEKIGAPEEPEDNAAAGQEAGEDVGVEDGAGDDDANEQEEGDEGDEEEFDGVGAFLRVFTSIQKTLDSKDISSLSTLLPIMSVVEGTLTTADEQGIQWQSDPQAVATVSDVLNRIRATQAALRAKGSATSSSVKALADATARIQATPPQSRAELTPYLELLKSRMSAPTFTPAEMSAMEALKDAIIAAGQRLKGSEDASNGTDVDGATEAHREEEQEPPHDSRIAGTLRDISERLRDTPLTDEDLAHYEAIVDQLASAAGESANFADSIESVREQLRLQRARGTQAAAGDATAPNGTDAVELHDDTKSPPPDPQNDESPGAFDEDDADNSSVAVDVAAELPDLEGVSEEGVIGGAENEVALLPKIEKRIHLPTEEFTAACTLFDIQNISKTLLHLSSGNEAVRRDVSLRKRIDDAKATFITQLAAFRVAENASTAAVSSSQLKVTGEDREGSGEAKTTHELVVFTSDEGEQYPVNETLMKHLQEARNVVSPTLKSDVAAGWKGASAAFLVYAFDGAPEDETEHSTALSELVLLHEVLTKRYGFKVTTITDPKLSADTFLRMVKHAAESSQGRMLVYFATPPSRSAVAVPQAMTFHDDSVLEYSRVLEETRPLAERVVVVHSLPRKLEMVCRLGEKESPVMSVRLTRRAAEEVSKLRCWLYDGIFTPVIVELLCRDERTMLCPEDLINYAVTAMTRMKLNFGSFTDSEPASMAFFLPADSPS